MGRIEEGIARLMLDIYMCMCINNLLKLIDMLTC